MSIPTAASPSMRRGAITPPTPSDPERTLPRSLGVFSLTSIGVGATIGAGIFVLAGTASAQYAGPGIALSFIFSGIGCLFVALCFAELASMYPDAGGAYTYSRVAFGRFVGWMIGWNLLLEFLLGTVSTAVSWSGYVGALWGASSNNALNAFWRAPFSAEWGWSLRRVPGAIVNAPAVLLVLALTMVLALGVRRWTRVNSAVVVLKVAIILLVVAFGFAHVNPANWHPLVPPNTGAPGRYGWSGVLRGASAVFFAFIGFDAVTTASQESRNPSGDVPIAILATVGISAALYVLMSLVMTGLAPYSSLNAPHPFEAAVAAAGPSLQWLSGLVSLAATAGLTTVVLVLLSGQSRIFFAMARDGLLARRLATIHPRLETPLAAIVLTGLVTALLAGFFPIEVFLDLISLGVLVTFALTCIVVLALRYRRPNVRRPFRAPLGPLAPILGLVFSVATAVGVSSVDNWIRLALWTAVGLVIYFLFVARTSRSRSPRATAD